MVITAHSASLIVRSTHSYGYAVFFASTTVTCGRLLMLRRLLNIALSLTLLWFSTISPAAVFPSSQLAALRDLFNAGTEGGNVQSLCFSNWNFASSENPCEWVSLRCNRQNTSITEINLLTTITDGGSSAGCRISPGYLPTSLGSFTDLRKLVTWLAIPGNYPRVHLLSLELASAQLFG